MYVFSLLHQAVFVLLGIWYAAFHVQAEQAYACDRFIDSIGVNTHWDYPNTPYGYNSSLVMKALVNSGIRHIRCVPDTSGQKPYVDEILRSLFEQGMRCTMLMEPVQTLEYYANYTNAENSVGPAPYVIAWEGANEPDLFWVQNHVTYKGQPYPEGVFLWQHDIYHLAKSDPVISQEVTVLGPSSGVTYDPGAGHYNPLCNFSMDSVVDWGNFHPYPGGNPFSYPFPYAGLAKYYWQSDFPSINLDEYPQAFKWGSIPYNVSTTKMAATETGYSTNYLGGGTPLSSHNKYIPRLFLEYFHLGVQRTLLYEFVDEFVDNTNTNREANFGLMFRNCTAKPGLVSLTSLINLLDDSPDRSKPIVDPTFVPGSLNFRITVSAVGNFTRTQYVHHLLLQKKNGVFYLALWHEITADDNSHTPQALVLSPAMPTIIDFVGNVKNPVSATIYTYNSENVLSGTIDPKYNPSSNPSIQLFATPTVTVVELPGGGNNVKIV